MKKAMNLKTVLLAIMMVMVLAQVIVVCAEPVQFQIADQTQTLLIYTDEVIEIEDYETPMGILVTNDNEMEVIDFVLPGLTAALGIAILLIVRKEQRDIAKLRNRIALEEGIQE